MDPVAGVCGDRTYYASATATTVNGACNIGTATCIVLSGQDIRPGMLFTVGPPNKETNVVVSVVGTTVNLLNNLAATHAALEPVTAADAIGNGAEVDNDGGATGANAADAKCALMAGDGIDQDGVYVGSAIKNATDNCPNDWNPEQLNTDSPADASGDACDTDDDEDKLTDVVEWQSGSDPKNVFSPRMFDLDASGTVDVTDVLTMTGALATGYKLPLPPFPGCCCKMQPWSYVLTNNTGGNVNDLRIWFNDAVRIQKITDTASNTWVYTGNGTWTKYGMKTTGTLPNNGKITIWGISCKKRQLACWQWTLNGVAKGGGPDSMSRICTPIKLP
jgi:hypothetical protein